MEDAVEKVCDVTDDDERKNLFDDQMFAILGVVQPIEEAVRRSKPVISGELLHLFLGGLLSGCRGFVKIGASVVDMWLLVLLCPAMNVVGDCPIQNEVWDGRERENPFEAGRLRGWKSK